ncbi:MAG: gamma carbonic anhydrase family protein [Spirochaetes bacterium]|nr:gamma carbonic anhydrase family protein [Spirochaetota bacterium]
MPLYKVKDRIPVIGEGAWVAPSAEIIGDVRIGRGCYIGFGAILRGDYGTIDIGEESAIEEGVMIHARPLDTTLIGMRVTVGHMAMIHNARIADNAIIGMKAMVSDFSEIGEWALVAEQALVVRRQKIPAGMIYGGSPAREIGEMLERHRAEWGLAKQLYADLAKRYNIEVERIDPA